MSTQIFYISALNQEVNNSTSGLFTGAVTTQPNNTDVDFNLVNGTNGAVSVTDLGEFFMIKTTDACGNDTDATTNVTGVAKVAQSSLSSGGNGFQNNIENFFSGRASYLETLAETVFGSAQATDFFSNADTVMDSYQTAMASLTTALNASTSSTASQELFNAMLFNYPARFGLAYNADVSGNGSVGTYSGVTATGSSSGATCEVTTELDTTTNVARITRTGTATGTFTSDDAITIADGGGSGVDITISSLNSIQIALLNNTLTSNTALPFELGDTVRVLYTITPNVNQVAADGDDVGDDANPFTAFVDFVSSETAEVVVQDGYIVGATVNLSSTDGKVLSTGTTDEHGKIKFLISNTTDVFQYSVLGGTGRDIATNDSYEDVLETTSVGKGTFAINPITTTVTRSIDGTPTPSKIATAKSTLATNLGIDLADIDKDYIQYEKESVAKIVQQIETLKNTIKNAIDAPGEDVFTAIASKIKAGPIQLDNESDITGIIDKVTESRTDVETNTKSNIMKYIKNVNEQINLETGNNFAEVFEKISIRKKAAKTNTDATNDNKPNFVTDSFDDLTAINTTLDTIRAETTFYSLNGPRYLRKFIITNLIGDSRSQWSLGHIDFLDENGVRLNPVDYTEVAPRNTPPTADKPWAVSMYRPRNHNPINLIITDNMAQEDLDGQPTGDRNHHFIGAGWRNSNIEITLPRKLKVAFILFTAWKRYSDGRYSDREYDIRFQLKYSQLQNPSEVDESISEKYDLILNSGSGTTDLSSPHKKIYYTKKDVRSVFIHSDPTITSRAEILAKVPFLNTHVFSPLGNSNFIIENRYIARNTSLYRPN